MSTKSPRPNYTQPKPKTATQAKGAKPSTPAKGAKPATPAKGAKPPPILSTIAPTGSKTYQLHTAKPKTPAKGTKPKTPAKGAPKAKAAAVDRPTVPIQSSPITTKEIIKKYKNEKYITKKSKPSDNKKICTSKKISKKPHQKFLRDYMQPENKYRIRNRLLVYHGIGSGKTCSALSISEKWIDNREKLIKNGKLPRVLFIVPQSVISSVISELLFICGSNKRQYLKKSDIEKLKNSEPGSTEYKSLIKKAEDNISIYYELKSLTYSTVKKVDFNNRLVIIDEVHNLLYDPNISGKDKPPKIFEYTLRKTRIAEALRKKAKNDRNPQTDFTLLLMTATPLYNSVLQLASLVKLLVYPDTDSVTIPKLINSFIKFPFKPSTSSTKSFYATPAAKTKQDAVLQNSNYLEQILKGYISYYSGVGKAEKNVPGYPDVITKRPHLNIIGIQEAVYDAIVHGKINGAGITSLPLKVRGKIEDKYKDIKKQKNVLTSNIGYQKICNIAFSKSDIKLIAKNKNKNYKELLKLDKTLPTISIKFNEVIKNLEKSKGPNFVYSNFIQHGVKEFVTCLRANKYHKFKPGKKIEKDKKYYAVITGSTDIKTKRTIIDAYNKKTNKNGHVIKVLVGSSTLKEGVNLLRTDQVHLLEPYWNESQSIQAIGRARRFCSHKDIKPPKGKPNPIVNVFRYTVAPKGVKSADVKMAERSKSKLAPICNTEDVFKFVAIDCIMNKEANLNDNIKCPTH